MAIDANKPAAAVAAPAPSAADQNQPPQQQQQQEEALFEAKHAELVSKARDVAREFGVDVDAVVFRPGDGGAAAVRHEFLGGVGLKEAVGRAVAMDVSEMGPEEVAAHEKHLQRLRALVAHELRAKAAAKADKAAVAGATSTSSPAQQEMAGAAAAGSSKSGG